MIGKDYITFDLNEDAARKLGLSDEEIKRARRFYRNLKIDDFKKKMSISKAASIDVDLLVMRGCKGEEAHVEDNLGCYNPCTVVLVAKFPLLFTVEKQREWVSMVSSFFKRHIIRSYEVISREDNFMEIKDKSFATLESYMYDPKNKEQKEYFKMRYKKYSEGAPYGSVSGRKKDLAKMYHYCPNVSNLKNILVETQCEKGSF